MNTMKFISKMTMIAFSVLLCANGGCSGCDGGSSYLMLDSGIDTSGDSDTDGDSDGDTDGDADSDSDSDTETDTNCDEVDFSISGTKVDMLIVLDRSNSMCNEGLWKVMSEALVDVTGDLSDQVNFGLMLFPSLNCKGTNNQCATTGSPNVALTAADPAGEIEKLITGTNDVGCCGGTPISATLNSADTYLDAVANNLEKYVLLATDGAPNCNSNLDGATCDCMDELLPDGIGCDDGANYNKFCLDDDEAIKQAGDLFTAGYPVYVLGVGDSIDYQVTMNGIAKAGGTEEYNPVEDTNNLLDVLKNIVGEIVTCEFDIDWGSLADDASKDPSKVRFYGIDSEGNEYRIPYVDKCVDGEEGWSWVDSDKILFCDASCADLQGGAWDTVTATFGCDSNGGLI